MTGDANPEKNSKYLAAKTAAFYTALWTVMLLAIGMLIVWLAQELLKIKGDAVYVTLLLVPVVVYLLVTGQLGELKLPGVTLTAMRDQIADVRKEVMDVGELEPERSTYLGKLRQVQSKDGVDFFLIYADVVGLRTYTRKLYLQQKSDAAKSTGSAESKHGKKRTGPDSGTGYPGERKTEKEIRETIIRNLAIALTDAFYRRISNRDFKGAKHDIFFLEDPDVAMIVRKISLKKAQEIAKEAGKVFSDEYNCRAKTVVLGPWEANISPRDLDKAAASRLASSE